MLQFELRKVYGDLARRIVNDITEKSGGSVKALILPPFYHKSKRNSDFGTHEQTEFFEL